MSVIPYLETKDWERLGVTAVGDRVVLAQLSKAQLSKWHFSFCICRVHNNEHTQTLKFHWRNCLS